MNKNSGLGLIIIRVIFILACFLLIKNFAGAMFNKSYLTFTSLLNWMGNVNTITFKSSIYDFTIRADWKVLNGLRDFFNTLTLPLGVVWYLCVNLLNMIIFCGQFITLLFF